MNKSTVTTSGNQAPIACKPFKKPKKQINFHLADSRLPEEKYSYGEDLLESARHFLPKVGQ